jgi:A/G-specific adenine glycosylase
MQRGERIRLFVEAIWAWYAFHKRTLPWRDVQDSDPDLRAYKVLVSEIMLQQTQVPRVIVKYKEFVQVFPSLEALSMASNRDVLMAWRGMGYNSRALRLRDAARTIRDGDRIRDRPNPNPIPTPMFPQSMEHLLEIPGIGHYTAAAIRNFAFNIPTPCIDTNIRRILHRTFFGPEETDGTWRVRDTKILELAGEILDSALQLPIAPCPLPFSRTAAEWHAALMDFGSLVQTKRNPKWEICPLTANGIMRTTKKNYESRIMNNEKSHNFLFIIRNSRREPGREIAGKFVPNRIIRGKVVEFLRDASSPVTLERIGREICMDWDAREHHSWLAPIVEKLVRDALVAKVKSGYQLQA